MSDSFQINMQAIESLGTNDPSSQQAKQALQSKNISSSEMLYMRLCKNESLNSGYFSENQVVASRGQHPSVAHFIVKGMAVAKDTTGNFKLGPGAVIGLAEGLSQNTYAWDVIAQSSLTTKVIPLDRSLREIRRLNSGLKGVCRITVMRILNLSSAPESLL